MVNKVTLIGRVGQQPEVKQVGENTLTKFSLATSESYKDKSGEWKELTQWHNVTIWREFKAEKGDIVYVDGKIEYREHDGKYYTDIKAEKCRKISGGGSGKTEKAPDLELPEPTSSQMTALKIKVKKGEITTADVLTKFNLNIQQLAELRAAEPTVSDDIPF